MIMAGRPDDPSYMASVIQATKAILGAGKAAEFTEEELDHKRASGSAAVNVGTYHGGGTKKPVNLDNGKRSEVLKDLVKNPGISRMAGFADGAHTSPLHPTKHPCPISRFSTLDASGI